MRVLGIDPGLTGACALIDSAALTIACEPLPVQWVKRSGKDKKVLDEDAMCALWRLWLPDVAWVENVFSMKGEGHAGAFTFGEGKGMLKGTLAGCGVRRRYVSPQVWKKDLNVSVEPVLITARCNRLFPGCAKLLKSEGKREAAMITLWGCAALSIRLTGPLTPVPSLPKGWFTPVPEMAA